MDAVALLACSRLAEDRPQQGVFAGSSEAGKQSENTLLDTFERYLEGYTTLFDATWSV